MTMKILKTINRQISEDRIIGKSHLSKQPYKEIPSLVVRNVL